MPSISSFNHPDRGPDDLHNAIYDPDLGYAYNPSTGRLWRIVEIETVKIRSYDERLIPAKVNFLGMGKVVTHIMWKLMTGEWPKQGHYIDHKNGVVYDMMWGNLREATPQQNAANRESPGRWNNTELKLELGVYKEHNRFCVYIGKQYHGRFDSAEEANAFSLKKRKELYGDFVRESANV